MADGLTPGRPNPGLSCEQRAWDLFQRLRDRGIPVESFARLTDYLSDCFEKMLLPQVNDVLRSLFPKARERGLIPRLEPRSLSSAGGSGNPEWDTSSWPWPTQQELPRPVAGHSDSRCLTGKSDHVESRA